MLCTKRIFPPGLEQTNFLNLTAKDRESVFNICLQQAETVT